MISQYARKSGMLDHITLTVESGGIGGFPASGKVFGAMIGAQAYYEYLAGNVADMSLNAYATKSILGEAL